MSFTDNSKLKSALKGMARGKGRSDSSADISLTKDDVRSFARLEGVNKAMPLMGAMSKADILGEHLSCYAWGVDGEAKDIISIEPVHGRLIDGADISSRSMVCVIDEKLAEESYGRSNIVGKTVGIYLGGQYYDFTVVGVAKSGITGLQSMMAGIIPDFAYVPFTTMQDITGKNTFDKIALLLNKDSADKNLTLTLKEEINGLKNTENAIAIKGTASGHTGHNLRRTFSDCGNKPVGVGNYRDDDNVSKRGRENKGNRNKKIHRRKGQRHYGGVSFGKRTADRFGQHRRNYFGSFGLLARVPYFGRRAYSSRYGHCRSFFLFGIYGCGVWGVSCG